MSRSNMNAAKTIARLYYLQGRIEALRIEAKYTSKVEIKKQSPGLLCLDKWGREMNNKLKEELSKSVCLDYNGVEMRGGFDFSKLKKVPENSIEAKLYKIIDDIDTATDMFKPEKTNFMKYVYKKIRESKQYIISDGYELYYKEGI